MSTLTTRERASGRIHVMVETPAGSRAKFKLDESLGLFKLHKMLPRGASFPFDFGFIPGTRGEDGDPLDVLVLAEEPLPQGCLVTVRLLGILEAEQTERGRDDPQRSSDRGTRDREDPSHRAIAG